MRTKFVLGLVGLLAVAAAPKSASADTVQYSTSGYFGSFPGVTTISNGGESLTFSGLSMISVNTPTTASFGDLTPTFGAVGSNGDFTGLFTLVITQLTGGSASKSITGSVSGGLGVSASGAPSSTVLVNFGSQSVTFPEGNGRSATYSPFATPVGTQTSTVQGSIASTTAPLTPLPKSIYATGGLLGLVALRQLVRKTGAIA